MAAKKKPLEPLPERAPPFVEGLDRRSRFALRDGSVSAFLDDRGIVLSLPDPRSSPRRTWGVRWSMAGARTVEPRPAGDPLPGVVNDLRGDPRAHRQGLRTYDRVVYPEVFDGVDLEVEPRIHGLETTLRVAAGAPVPELRFKLDGVKSLSVTDGGDSLEIETEVGRLREGKLLAFQDGRDGERHEVPVRYAYARRGSEARGWEYGLEIGSHDPSLPLVIDPTLAWSTFLGGDTGDLLWGMAVDTAGNRYVTGYTVSAGTFPIVGGFDSTLEGPNDVFITKIGGVGETIIWSTLYGGGGADHGKDIAVDASSNVYVVGETDSSNLTIVGGFDNTFGGGANRTDGFLLKIAANGASIIWSSYLGGVSDDVIEAMALDASNNVYVTGSTRSTDFPFVAGFDSTYGGGGGSPPDAFVAAVSATGSTLRFSSYLGGGADDTGYDISVDATGVWVVGFTASPDFPTTAGVYDRTLAGTDAFLTKVNLTGSAITWSTLLGGGGIDQGIGLAIDGSGNAYIAGETSSPDFPLVGAFDTLLGGPQDQFVARIGPNGASLLWSTYLGGSGQDDTMCLELDAAGQLFVGGETTSADYPLIGGPFDTTYGGTSEGVIVRINSGGATLGWSSYLGGGGSERVFSLGWDSAGNLYAAGETTSADFPGVSGGFDPSLGGVLDGYLARITSSGVVPPSVSGPVKLAFTTAAQTVPAGSCSAAVTVQSQDASSLPANVTSATTVSLSAIPSTGFAFYSDPACGSAIGSVVIPAGGNSATFYFRGTVAGSVNVTASAAGLASGSQTETITAVAATALFFTTAAQTVPAGSCSAIATVQRRDTFGNPVTAGATTVNLSVSPTTGFVFYSDPACGTVASSVTIGAGSSTGSFYFRGISVGTFNVTASATGLTSASQTETITAGAAFGLFFTTAAQTVAAGSCSAIATIERRDTWGNPVTAGATTVSLAVSPTTGFTFYSDPACGTAASSFTIGAGSSTGSFYFRGTAAGSFTVTPSATGLVANTQVETITAGAASALAFTTAAQTVAAGSCSGITTVQRRDSFGNPVTIGTTTVNLSVSPITGFTFYSDPACGTAATSFTIADGSSAGSFYFRGTSAGTFNATASAAGLTSGSQTETITAGAASALFFTTTAQTVAAGSCSGIATVQRRDTFGNPVTAGSTTVNLSVSPTTGFTFYSDPACGTAATSFTIGAGASTGSFYFRGTSAGSFNVTASATGLTSASQTETITAGAASALFFTTAAQTVAAGSCSAIATVERRDTFGNPVTTGTTTVNLSASPAAGFTFYSDPACGTAVTSVTIGAGSSSGSFYFRGTVAGTVNVTAAATGLTSAVQAETITALAASALAFTTTAQTVPAGNCSAVATVQRRDSFGNPVTAGATTVNLTVSPTTGFTFYSDPACGTAATSITIGAGASTGSFYFRGTSVGSFNVTASATGLTSASQTETITAVAAAALFFTTSAQTVPAGSCSAIATVERRDTFGNPATSGTTTVNLSASPAAGFTFYSDPACGTAATSITIGAGASTGSFYFRGTAAGSVSVTASATGLTSASQTETITALAASALFFTTGAQTVAAGSCSAIATVQRRDTFGNPVTAGSTTVNLTVSPTTGFTFYSDPACGTAATSITVGAGASTGSFYFRGTAAGSFNVTAAATGLTSASQTETITPLAASALAFTSAAQTVAAGSCSAVATVERRDTFGNPISTGTTTVNLSASPAAGFTFYSDPACGTAATSITIGAGASAGSFYFRGTAAGTVNVTASATGLTSTSQTETITALAASALFFTTTAQTVAAGSCSAVATVQRRDTFGNPATTGTTTVNLSVSPTTGFTFYSDPACTTVAASFTIGAGASTGSFYFRGITAGSFNVTAAATGLTSASQTETITTLVASALFFTTTAQTVAAGSCSAVATIERRDTFGNPVTAGSTTVNLTVSPTTGFAFYSDPACGTAATSITIGAGASTASFYFRGTSVGSFNVTAAATGLTSASQTETIIAVAASALFFTTAAQTVAAGSCSAIATVERRDTFGNPSTTGTTTVNLSASPAAGFTFYSDPACGAAATSITIGAGASTGSFYFRGTAAGTVNVTASSTGLTSASQTETITALAPSALFFTTTAQTVAAGTCSAIATVQRRDSFGNPSTTGTTTVNLSVSPTTGFTFYSDPACGTAATSFTIGAGASTGSFYFRGTSAGSFNVTAAATGLTSTSQTETINPLAAASALFFTSVAQTVAAGSCSALATIERRDTFGNPVTSGTTTVNLSASPAAGFTFYSDPACGTAATSFTIGAGASTGSFYFRGTAAGTVNVTAAATGLTSASQTETITALAPSALAFTTSAQTLGAGSCSAIATVQRRDTFGNPATTGTTTVNLSVSPTTGFTFYSDPACGTAATSITIGAGASTGSFYFRGTAAGSFNVTAAATGLTSASQTETINPLAASVLAFTTSAQTISAGNCSAVATVERRDSFGNPISTGSTTVNLSVSPTTGFTFYSDPACGTAATSFTIGAGASTGSFYFRGTAAGSFDVTAAATGLTSASQTEVINPAAASNLVFTTAAQTISAGSCSAIASVQRQDLLGNPVTTGTTTVNLSVSPTAGFAFYSDPACGTAATSFTIGAGASTGSFYFRSTAAGSFGVTASATGFTNASQTEVINPLAASALFFTTTAQTVGVGSCSGIATIQRRDTFGNPATSGTTTVNLSASPAAGFTFYSDPACGTAVTSFTIGAGGSTGSFYFRGTAAGTVNVTAAATGLTSATQAETIAAGAATALAFTTAAQTVAAGNCSAVATVERRDTFGNPATIGTTTVNLSASPAAGFTFYSDPACGTAATSFTIGAGSSTGSFYFRGTAAGSVSVTAAATGLTSASQTETITALAASALAFTTPAQTVAAGACSAIATVQRRDSFGNPATTGAATVNLSVSPTTGFTFYSDPACGTVATSFTIGAGASTGSFYFRGTAAGSFNVTAAATGLTSASQTETIAAGTANRFVYITAPQTLAHGSCSALVTVQTQDGSGNPSPVAVGTPLTFSSPTGTMTFYSDPACAVALAGPVMNAGDTTFSLYFKDSGVGAKTMNVNATGFTGASQTHTLTNATPVANAGADQSRGEGQPVTLDATASSDADGDTLTYQWTQTAGPAVTLSSSTASQPTFTTPTVLVTTTLTFQVVVNDGFVASAPDTVQITVNNDVNEPPVASAGADLNTQSGLTFVLDGTGSSDPNGSTLTYQWTQTAGPAVAMADPTTATQSLVAPLVATNTTLTFRLVVNDGTAPSAADSVNVVVAPPPLPSIVSVPRRLTATGVAYQYDDDSTLEAIGAGPITFSLAQGPAGFNVSPAGVVTYTPSAEGAFPIRIRATNPNGSVDQTYSLRVVSAPVITSTARTTAAPFVPYQYDADGRPTAVGTPSIGWSLVQAPAGAVVVYDTGEILWTPLESGPAQFMLRAANAFGFDDQAFTVQVGSASLPVIEATANANALVGQPYIYDADGKVGVQPSTAPVAVESGPPGFRVDPLTGEVSWTPLAAGPVQVQLVAGVAPARSAPYAFQVNVVAVDASPPTAVASAQPASGEGPLNVTLDGTGSSAAGGRSLVMFQWEPGDGSPPTRTPVISHSYTAPGGYTPSLLVLDELGMRAIASTSVQVGSGGVLPPTAQLFVDQIQPQSDGSVAVTLRCQCADPQGQPLSYYWEMGDGTISDQASPTHAYLTAGAYRVQLTVSNRTLSTRASTDVVANRGSDVPPQARAYASPVRGVAPLTVRFTGSARDQDGFVLRREWSFPDGASSDMPQVDRLFSAPGVYPVTFRVTDDDGLTSTDRVVVTVLAADGTEPPRFVSTGARTGKVGVAYEYDADGRPSVLGTAPITFALPTAPAGATIDAQTGALTWTPSEDGVAHLVITATNAAGSTVQDLLVQVQPPDGLPPDPCGCGQGGGSTSAVGAAGLLLLLAMRRRRARAGRA